MIELWSEGYVAQGNSSDAHLLGMYKADSFDDAVEIYLSGHEHNRKYFDKRDGVWYFWGCRLFDNEADARKLFG